MAARLTELGGTVYTGIRVRSITELPPSTVTMFDLAPESVAEILGGRLPRRVSRAYRRFRRGPGAFKVDLAVEGGVPWSNPSALKAGTVHLGGTFDEIARAERDVNAGRMPARPFVLVGQQYLADPQRSLGNVHPVWSYAHVPHGYNGDATEAVILQIERFAPGFRERIVGKLSQSTSDLAEYNSNFAGGDILTGAKDVFQLAFGPRVGLNPYVTGVPGYYMCSAATPPGPGAHGMCGYHAARVAIGHLRGRARATSFEVDFSNDGR
jgi:phytoene dehydrogenase-like protein